MSWHGWGSPAASNSGSRGIVLDLTSLVDVLFNLLFFFMLTAGMARQTAFNVRLPQVESGPALRERQGLTIGVTHDGRVLWNNQPLALQEVLHKLQELPASKREHVRLQADGRAAHRDVARIMSGLYQVGTRHIAVITQGSATSGQ
ncbi:MAG: biopolymer transporter ExbD [Myxococcota bacterium]